jgi:hypothetical protein
MGGACGIYLPKFKQSIHKLFESYVESKQLTMHTIDIIDKLPVYGTDEEFLESTIYSIIKSDWI